MAKLDQDLLESHRPTSILSFIYTSWEHGSDSAAGELQKKSDQMFQSSSQQNQHLVKVQLIFSEFQTMG